MEPFADKETIKQRIELIRRRVERLCDRCDKPAVYGPSVLSRATGPYLCKECQAKNVR